MRGLGGLTAIVLVLPVLQYLARVAGAMKFYAKSTRISVATIVFHPGSADKGLAAWALTQPQ
jgi:hypothetical protein